MTAQLFTPTPRARHRHTRALALYRCELCLTPAVHRDTYIQPALFAHGGYGAAEAISSSRCNCGALEVLELDTLNPRPYR